MIINFINRKVKAQAMHFALLVSVVTALILGAFLLLIHSKSLLNAKSTEIVNSFELLNHNIIASMGKKYPDTTLMLIEDRYQVRTHTGYYGAYTKVYSNIAVQNQGFKKSALIGIKKTLQTSNLYLAEKNSPLVMVGNSKLEGIHYLPKQGIKVGTIAGEFYQGSTLYTGKTFLSSPNLPKLEPDWIRYIKNLNNGYGDTIGIEAVLQPVIKNSFYNPTLIIEDESPILLDSEEISGNVHIISHTKITVSKRAILNDVILQAPVVQIRNNTKGTFQIIASKSVSIGKESTLYYPSAIIFENKNVKKQTPSASSFVTIGENSKLEGSIVIFDNHHQGNQIKPLLTIKKGSKVLGEIYCEGNIEFEGKIQGSLYTYGFITKKTGSVYLNHMYNLQIKPNSWPSFAGLPFENRDYTIGKWLY